MTAITTRPYILPLRRPWGRPDGPRTRRGVLVHHGDGWGDAALLPDAPREEDDALRRHLEAALHTHKLGLAGPARHALEQASLSEAAFTQSTPLGRLIGERIQSKPRTQVLVHATLPRMTSAATVRLARARVRDGYRTIKLKIGPGPEEPARVQAVREALGAGIQLRIDPNGAWTPLVARKRIHDLVRADIELIEQPTAPGDHETLLALAAESKIPIAPDEDAANPILARRLLRSGVLTHIILKPMMLGGLDFAAQLVQEAQAQDVLPIVTDVVESGVGRAGALHLASVTHRADVAHGLGSGTYLARDLVKPSLVPQNGRLRVPTRPGLGVRLENRA